MGKPVNLPLGRSDIETILPHRDPMLFIDRVTAVNDEGITAEADIKPEAAFFKGHFPRFSIMPGVLVIETVAQAGALLIALTRDLEEGKFLALVSVDSVKFRRSVYPNETLIVDVGIEKIRGPFYKFKGTARVNNEIVAEPYFTAAAIALNED